MSELVGCTELQALSDRGAPGDGSCPSACLVVNLPCCEVTSLHAGHNWQAEQWQWDAQGFKAEPAGKPVASSTSGSGRASKEADTTTGSGQHSGSVDTGRVKVCLSKALLVPGACRFLIVCSGKIMYAAYAQVQLLVLWQPYKQPCIEG